MIFLSYSREDKDVAANLAAILSERGFEIVRDPTLVRGDPFWRRTVRNSLDESELLVVLWSRHAAQSPWVDQEIRYFDKETHFVFLDKEKEQLRTGPHRAASREVENIITEIVHSLKRQQGGSTDKDVSSQRRDLVTAEEARLKSFCHDMGHRVANVTAVEDESLRLSDGTLMIRLRNNSSEEVGSTYVAATPVTNEQYQEFVSATGFPPPVTWQFASFASATAPVTGVSWFDAKAYAAWIGGDLPTQQEWEAAATGGKSKVNYATSDGRIAEGTAHFGVRFAEGCPKPSLAFSPNPSGFYGMCGNTWDWCSTKDRDHRRICGGGYMDSAEFCKIKAVYRNAPIDPDCSVGFRMKVVI